MRRHRLTGRHFLPGRQSLSGRLARFSVAGSIGFVVQVATLWLLISFTGIHYLVASAMAVELAIVVNFVWHQRWTFKDRAYGAYSAIGRLLKYNGLTAITSIFGSVLVTGLLVETFTIPVLFANMISVVVLGGLNFIGADKLVFRSAVAALALMLSANAFASDEAKLQPKTAAGFSKYAAAVEARRARAIANNEPFLQFARHSAAEQARIMATLRRGEVFVERAASARDQASNEISVEGGLVNHWRGTVFVPNVRLDALLKVLQEPQSDKHKQEDVLSSRVVSRDGDSQKVFLRLRRTKFVTVVYDTEYDVEYRRLTPDRALSNSISTKVVEIENAGTPRERALPEGDDHGYMWRLNSYWRYKQIDGGVLVEIESLTLSRPLPAIIGSIIRPIITSTARESMTRTLASLRARFS
jgi:putative flippase GtrA